MDVPDCASDFKQHLESQASDNTLTSLPTYTATYIDIGSFYFTNGHWHYDQLQLKLIHQNQIIVTPKLSSGILKTLTLNLSVTTCSHPNYSIALHLLPLNCMKYIIQYWLSCWTSMHTYRIEYVSRILTNSRVIVLLSLFFICLQLLTRLIMKSCCTDYY